MKRCMHYARKKKMELSLAFIWIYQLFLLECGELLMDSASSPLKNKRASPRLYLSGLEAESINAPRPEEQISPTRSTCSQFAIYTSSEWLGNIVNLIILIDF